MTINDITTATPVQIDTELCRLHVNLMQAKQLIASRENRLLDYSGLRVYVSGDWHRKSRYEVRGTVKEAIALLTAHEAAWDEYRANNYQGTAPARLSNYAGSVDIAETVSEISGARDLANKIRGDIAVLDAEFFYRDGWSRYYVVTSSAGHIHSSVFCQTCYSSTTFGWMPNLAGMTEAEAIAELGDHAEALCSVCYPNAPVNPKRKNVTKAKAAKLSAGDFVKE